jgi:hypothetical protein
MTSESNLFYEEELAAGKRAADLLAAKRTATYDPRCYELAELYLEGERLASKTNCDELAIEIQHCVDEFLVAKHAEALEAEYQRHIDYRLEDKRDER